MGANAQEADGASSRADFLAKNRIALKEAKETRWLLVCRQCELLDERFEPLVRESEEIVRIIAAIVHNTIANDNRRQRDKLTPPF